MSQPRNSAGNARVAWELLRASRPAQMPGIAYYFFGLFARKLLGVRLFEHRVLHFQNVLCHAALDGGCGLVFLYEIWIRNTYDALPSAEFTDGVLFDVGANCGFFVLRQSLRNPSLRAFCFEPHPRTFNVLQRNIELNGLSDRVKAVGCAVGAESGKCQIEVSDVSSMAVVSQGSPVTNKGQTAINIPLVSLDAFCHDHAVWPDTLKIDVEGFEVEVLLGASECLRKAKRLVLEFHSEALGKRCLELLSSRFDTHVVGLLIFAKARS